MPWALGRDCTFSPLMSHGRGLRYLVVLVRTFRLELNPCIKRVLCTFDCTAVAVCGKAKPVNRLTTSVGWL